MDARIATMLIACIGDGKVELDRSKGPPDTKLIIIDTWAKIKKPQKTSGYFYEEDYLAVSQIQEFAAKYKISVIAFHHTRKIKAVDSFDEMPHIIDPDWNNHYAAVSFSQTMQARLYITLDMEKGEISSAEIIEISEVNSDY